MKFLLRYFLTNKGRCLWIFVNYLLQYSIKILEKKWKSYKTEDYSL
jgi:hypothetical protein